MDANTNDFILVLEEKDKKKLSVVSSMDSQGNIKTVEPLDANSRHFMKFRKNDSLFKNFIENLSKQFKDPFHFRLYKMVADKVEASVNVLREMLQKPEENEDTIRLMQVNLEEYSLKEQLGKVDETRIDWEELSAIGLSREQLLDSGNLEKMLSWGKSNLVPITIPFGDRTIYTEARLAFRENAEGNLTLAIHTIRKEPKLDFPFMGVQFTGEDKTNLLTTGNLGRIAEVTPKNGEPFQAFVSIDPQTNELVALKSNRVRIPTEIKGVTLSQLDEVKARIDKAIARVQKSVMKKNNGLFYISPFVTFNKSTRQLTIKGKKEELKSMESRILWLFCIRINETVTYTEMCENLWGFHSTDKEKSLTRYICLLNKKLTSIPTVYIQNDFGIGYKLVSE